MKRLLYLLLPGLFILGFALGYLFSHLPLARSPKLVQTSVAAMRDFAPQVSVTGKVWPRATVKVSAKRAGIVEAIYFAEGQLVKKGEAIAKLDDAAQHIEVAQAEGALARARADMEKKRARGRPEEDIAAAEAELSFREARLLKAKQSLAHSLVSAPMDGVVERIYAQAGQGVAKGGKIMELADLARVLVKANIEQKDLRLINRGAPAQARFDDFPGRAFSGRVIYLSSTADKTGQTFPVSIELENPDLALKAGIMAQVVITAPMREKVLMVPKAALLSQSDNKGLFVVAESRALFRKVETGHEREGYVEIRTNLKAGEVVVISGQESLKDGDKAAVKGNIE